MTKKTTVTLIISLFILLSSLVCGRGSGVTPIGKSPTSQTQITPSTQENQTQTQPIPKTTIPTVKSTQAQAEQPLSGSNLGPMIKTTVANAEARNAVCNDGTPAIYYIRRGVGEGMKRWLIHLQGGGYCYDPASCKARGGQEANLMTTKNTPNNRPGNGIFSPSGSDNKYFATYNEIYIAYCSSDLWSGNQAASVNTDQLQFRGASIVHAVIEDLSDSSITSDPNLSAATEIIFSGTSAGGVGVLVHLDWIAEKFPNANVHGINDAGFIIDTAPYDPKIVPVSQVAQLAYTYWNASVDASCAAAYQGKEGLCYLGQHAYPQISTPLFVQLSQADKFQLGLLGIRTPLDQAETEFLDKFASAVRTALEPVTAAFSPDSLTHGLVASDEYTSVRVNNLSVQDVLGNWLFNLGGPIKVIAQQ